MNKKWLLFQSLNDFKIIKSGFYWDAFLFGIFYLVIHSLWFDVLAACISLLLFSFITILAFGFTKTAYIFILFGLLGLHIFIGFQASCLICDQLQRKGYWYVAAFDNKNKILIKIRSKFPSVWAE